MITLLMVDKDAATPLSEDLKAGIIQALEANGHRVEVYALGRAEVTQCRGCLLCLTEQAGECVTKDRVNEIRRKVRNYAATFFLTPVLFGHYSSNLACPINKGTGSKNLQVIIGYGEGIDPEEIRTFIDLTAQHRGSRDIIHPGMDKQVDVYYSGSREDNRHICRSIQKYIL